MLKRLGVLLLCLSLHLPVLAFSNSNTQNTLSGVIQAKMSQRGMPPSYPSFPRTLSAVGGAIAGYVAQALVVTVAGVTAPAWLSVAVMAGVTVLATAGIDWVLNSDGTVKLPDENGNVPAGPVQFVHCYHAQCAASKEAACNRKAGTWSNAYGQSGYQEYRYVAASDSCNLFRNYTAPTSSPWADYGTVGGYSVKTAGCPGISLNPSGGQCPASNFPVQVGAVVPYAEAVDVIAPEVKQAPVNPQIIADLANKAWMGAASAPGYDGVAFDAANPITVADVNAWRDQHPGSYPTLGEMLAPQPAPSGGTATTPFTLPTSPTPQAESAPESTVQNTTNPAAGNPLTNLGADPNIGLPNLETPPTAAQILDPVFSLLPSLRTYSVPQHSAVCPTATLNLLGGTQAFSAHCGLLEDVRPILALVMAAVWSFCALRITLSA